MVKINDTDIPYLEFAEAAAPGTPASAITRIYTKSDGLMYSKDDAGAETLMSGGAGGAPTTADYLVGTANGSLSAEIVVGTSPGGELGNTWASPTVDTTHSGSSHKSHPATAARSTRTTNQAITTATWTAVLFNVTDNYDTDTFHDPAGANPERFVAPVTGYYQVNFGAQFAGSATGDRYATFYVNGALYGGGFADRQAGNLTIGNRVVRNDIVAMTATDYVEGRVYQDSGGNLDVGAAFLSIALLGV